MDEPRAIMSLGSRGYLYSENGDVQSIDDHVSIISGASIQSDSQQEKQFEYKQEI